MICALIPFHRASCPTQMSALHVSTDNLITRGPHSFYCTCGGVLRLVLHFGSSLQSDLCPALPLHLHLLPHLFPISIPLSPSAPSPATPSLCFPPPFPPPFFPPLHPSPIHCYTSIFLLRFLLFHPSLHSLCLLSLFICHLSPPPHQCSGYTIAVVVVGGGGAGGWTCLTARFNELLWGIGLKPSNAACCYIADSLKQMRLC